MSTARSWLRSPERTVVSVPEQLQATVDELQAQVSDLQRRNERLLAILRLVVVLLKVSEFTLHRRRVPDASKKQLILRVVTRSQATLGLQASLRVLRLSSSRYHAWRGESACELEDVDSCPRSRPCQLTRAEVSEIRSMVTDDEYRHIPTASLALLAQREGRVFASSSTWHRLIRKHNWRRPRARVHPRKPKIGIRANTPDEVWHADATVIRLLDGSRVYVHALIDNYSRAVLAHRVASRLDPEATPSMLLDAIHRMNGDSRPTLIVDGGSENKGDAINELIESGKLKRLLAMTDVTFSNSMIESWWRSLKHNWLFLNQLDSLARIRQLVSFYVHEHNNVIPHSAFAGQTPAEVYSGAGDEIPRQLSVLREQARRERLEVNRETTCPACE